MNPSHFSLFFIVLCYCTATLLTVKAIHMALKGSPEDSWIKISRVAVVLVCAIALALLPEMLSTGPSVVWGSAK